MRKLLPLLLVLCGCGTMWDWTFGNPFPSAEEQIAEKCVEQTGSIEAQTGMMAAAAALNGDIDTKFYVCADNFFEERQESPRNALCLIGHEFFIFCRRIPPQYLCQGAFHEAYHIVSGDLYGYVDNALMSETCKGFSLDPPEDVSYVWD